jgi:uncharacterized membrane protein
MTELLGRVSALPNLHPAVIHFPVALVSVALLLELTSLVAVRQRWWLDRAAALVSVLAAAGASVAYLSGRQAEDGLLNVPATAQALLAQHANWALWTLVVLVALALAKLGMMAVERRGRRPVNAGVRAAMVGGAVLGQLVLFQAADRGGALVYRHGLAVSVPAPPDVPASSAAPGASAEGPEARLLRLAGGGLRWTPLTSDTAALGTVLRGAGGVTPSGVKAIAGGVDGMGLALTVADPVVLVLPGEFSDVVVDAEVDLAGFAGEVGLVHHVVDGSRFAVFSVATSGGAVLQTVAGGSATKLDAAAAEIASATVRLTSTVARGHLKGTVNGKTVVHGHAAAGPPGGVGLYLAGRGEVRVISVSVTPLSPAP